MGINGNTRVPQPQASKRIKMEKFLTVREAGAPEQLDRSPNWIRAAIKLEKIQAVKVGSTLIISSDEVDRLRREMPTISAKEMGAINVCR